MDEFKKRPSTRPCELRKNVSGDLTRSGATIEEVEVKANEYLDRKQTSKMKKKVCGGTEFSRLADLRQEYKSNDKFLIYRLNDKDLNGENTYVFKTSETNLEIIKMCFKGDHYMRSSPAYFDAKENRVRGMSTYTLSVYHLILRKQIPLACMDCSEENFENCVTFFKTLNKALEEKYGEEGVQFDPFLLVLDEKRCNWVALKSVYGKAFMDRVISCAFHFKQSVNRRANSHIFSSEDSKGKFKSLYRPMLEAQTVPKLMKELEHLRTFLHPKSKREVLLKWLDWWVSRKEHVFHALVHARTKAHPNQTLLRLSILLGCRHEKRT